MINLIPRLKMMNMYDNDILYSQGDQAEELFFVDIGSILLYIDVLDFLNMEPFHTSDEIFNIPMCIYSDGSYFGDNDMMLNKNGYRTSTAVCQQDTQIYAIKSASLDECLKEYPRIRKIMFKIAEEKQKYYTALKDEIKNKYRNKRDQEKLIKDKKHDEWTYYMSLKRKLVKKKTRIQNKMTKLRNHTLDEPLTLAMVKTKLTKDKEVK